MAKTFLALLALADLSNTKSTEPPASAVKDQPERVEPTLSDSAPGNGLGLHYNIQIHLPATKDVEVYNAIFKSLREHLLKQ